MNIFSFSSSGGAGGVAKALTSGFLELGIEANFIRATDANLWQAPLEMPSLTTRAAIDNFVLRRSSWPTHISYLRDKGRGGLDLIQDADMNIFRWMNGMLPRHLHDEDLNLRNLVWGLDDMNPFTGVCHYSGACDGFKVQCQNCPALRKGLQHMAQLSLQRKTEMVNRLSPRFVSPTNWMKEKFEGSTIGKESEVRTIPNPLKPEFLSGPIQRKPGPKNVLRILIVATNLDDPVKGVLDVSDTLVKAKQHQRLELGFVGKSSPRLEKIFPNSRFYGHLSTIKLIEVMRSYDVLLLSSREEAAGMVLAEAASQSLPSLARAVGGVPEMVADGETGLLFNSNQDLAEVLNGLSRTACIKLGRNARDWAESLKPSLVAEQYLKNFPPRKP